MKRLIVTVVMVLGLFAVGISSANTAIAGWHELSQSQRNSAIINRAYQDIDTYQGSCKVWVQNVVWGASSGAVWPPQTIDPPGCQWYYNQYVINRCGYLEQAAPGEIVQMQLKSGTLHTAIILIISSWGVTFIESNWRLDGYVHTRSLSFADFYNQVNCFTIYTIL